MMAWRKIFCIAAVAIMMLALTSCAVLQGILGELGLGELSTFLSKYSARPSAISALVSGSAEFEDLPLDDQWGLIWNGLFTSFIETDKEGDTRNGHRMALSAIGVEADCYDSYRHEETPIRDWRTGEVTGYTEPYSTYYFHVSDRDDIIWLVSVAIYLIDIQKDPIIACLWLEDLYDAIEKTDGDYNGYVLMPYLSAVRKAAVRLFDLDEDPSKLSDDSPSAKAADFYLGKFPAGRFIDLAQKRQRITSGIDSDLVM